MLLSEMSAEPQACSAHQVGLAGSAGKASKLPPSLPKLAVFVRA